MAVIGHWSAVANAFGLHLSGFLAWMMWAGIHLTYIVTFQSRVLVFFQWIMQDLTRSRGARLITGVAMTNVNLNKEVDGHHDTEEVKAESASGPH
jgi:NADH dehydrogenase